MAQTSRLKIAHVTPVFGPGGGGTGQAVWQLVRAFGNDPSHAVDVFVPSNQVDDQNPGGNYRLHPLPPRLSIGKAAWLPNLTKELRYFDLIHLHYPFFGGAEFVLAAHRRYQIPYVMTYHTETIFAQPILNFGHNLYKKRYLAPLIRSTSLVIGLTGAHLFASSAGPYLTPTKVAIIGNGVNEEFFEVPIPPAKRSIPFTLGFCAELASSHYYKGLDLVLGALPHLPSVRLLVVGDGPLRPRYSSQAQKLGLTNRVIFLGRKTGHDLVSFYDAIDLLVSPSKIPESFGIVNFEALARGKRVLTAPSPAAQELAQPFPRGILNFLPEVSTQAIIQAVGELAGQPVDDKTVAETQHIVADQFRWAAIARTIWKHYEELK